MFKSSPNSMKNIVVITLLAFAVSACGGGSQPEGPDQIKEKIAKLKADKKSLEDQISALEAQLPKDTNVIVLNDVRTRVFPKTTFADSVEIQGSVASDDNVLVSSENGGRILKILVKEGASVSKGQLLANLDGEYLQNSVEEVEKALELAVVAYDRQKNLWDQKIGSEIQFLQAKNQKESLEKKLVTMKNQLGKFSLRSPISGTVDKIFMNEGELANPGFPIVRVVNNSELKVVAEVSERYVGAFNSGQSVRIIFPVLGRSISGKIRSVGQVIEAANRTFSLIVDPAGRAENFMKPNLLAQVKVQVYRNESAVSLPTSLIRFEGEEKFVYAVKDKKVMKLPVKTGITTNGYTEILSGIEGTEEIITEGYKNVEPGDEVNVLK